MYYVAKIERDGDGWSASFPDVPSAMTCADTKEEVLAEAKDALEGVLAVMLDQKDALPARKTLPNERRGLYAIDVDPALSFAYQAFEARRGKPAATIARRMGVTRQNFSRIENPRSNLSIKMMKKAAKALGKRLEISLV